MAATQNADELKMLLGIMQMHSCSHSVKASDPKAHVHERASERVTARVRPKKQCRKVAFS